MLCRGRRPFSGTGRRKPRQGCGREQRQRADSTSCIEALQSPVLSERATCSWPCTSRRTNGDSTTN